LGDKNTKIRNASFYVKIPTYSTFVVYLTNHIIYGITSLTFNDNTSIVCNWIIILNCIRRSKVAY